MSPVLLLDFGTGAVALALCVEMVLELARVRSGAVRHAAWGGESPGFGRNTLQIRF